MSEDFFSVNFSHDPGIYYFLYIGELKNLGLAGFLESFFAEKLPQEVRCIGIVPDRFEQYNYANLVVYSPDGIPIAGKNTTCRVSSRCNPGDFFRAVSSSPMIGDLIDRLLLNQNELYIYMYESSVEMTLDQREKVYLLGPDKALAQRFNNKAVQFQELSELVPVVDFQLCSTYAELLEVTEKLRAEWSDGIFVSQVYSAAGSASLVSQSQEQLAEKFSTEDGPFLISRYMIHDYDPTVLAVVANEEDVYIAGVADQCIEGGNRFVGSTWPSILSREMQQELHDHTRTVGRLLGRQGYRGIFGCDYIVTPEGQIKFIEINARKQGTTLQFCYALKQVLPPGSPSLPELEYFAVVENRFPERTVEYLPADDPPFCWGTFNYKLHQDCRTCGYIPQAVHQEESFSRIAQGRLNKDYLIVEHIGSGVEISQGTFLARVVSLGRSHLDVSEGLELGRRHIELTIDR